MNQRPTKSQTICARGCAEGRCPHGIRFRPCSGKLAYANTMHMSKQGVYDQLTSEYGGQFSAEAAQYAIDNVQTDWNANTRLPRRRAIPTACTCPSRGFLTS
jgi:hypothetical protein